MLPDERGGQNTAKMAGDTVGSARVSVQTGGSLRPVPTAGLSFSPVLSPCSSICQSPGHAWRFPRSAPATSLPSSPIGPVLPRPGAPQVVAGRCLAQMCGMTERRPRGPDRAPSGSSAQLASPTSRPRPPTTTVRVPLILLPYHACSWSGTRYRSSLAARVRSPTACSALCPRTSSRRRAQSATTLTRRPPDTALRSCGLLVSTVTTSRLVPRRS